MSIIKSSIILLALLSFAIASPLVKIAKSEFLGNVTGNTNSIRDLGFHGTIGDVGINVYGDTFHCKDMTSTDRSDCTLPLAVNTAAYSTDDPLKVEDFLLHGVAPEQMPLVWCGYFPSEQPQSSYGMGITNVVQTGYKKGVTYFLKNHRPHGVSTMVGAGVAIVDTSGAIPTCTRTAEYWWDASKEPFFGDHGAVDGRDGKIYVLGGWLHNQNVYLARVGYHKVADLASYQYWNGKEFTSNRIYNPTDEQMVLPSTGQGTPIWSVYLHCWMYISSEWWNLSGFSIRTADHLSGPWSDPVEVFVAPAYPPGNWCYAPTFNTQYDLTMKTVVITYTHGPNIQQAARITFE